MLTITLNVGNITEGIARLAANHHGSELLSYVAECGPGGRHHVARFLCPSREAANSLVFSLYGDAEEVLALVVELDASQQSYHLN